MRYIVDRFEGELVVCEDSERKMHNFNKSMFYPSVKVDDVVELVNDQFQLKEEITKERQERIRKKMDQLWE